MKQADLQSSIIAHRNDRMGARIISMLNAIRIARDYDIPWFCGWTTGGRTHEECRDPTYISARILSSGSSSTGMCYIRSITI